jgi:hypothetical protein
MGSNESSMSSKPLDSPKTQSSECSKSPAVLESSSADIFSMLRNTEETSLPTKSPELHKSSSVGTSIEPSSTEEPSQHP